MLIGSVDMRRGPSDKYRVIDNLAAGMNVSTPVSRSSFERVANDAEKQRRLVPVGV